MYLVITKLFVCMSKVFSHLPKAKLQPLAWYDLNGLWSFVHAVYSYFFGQWYDHPVPLIFVRDKSSVTPEVLVCAFWKRNIQVRTKNHGPHDGKWLFPYIMLCLQKISCHNFSERKFLIQIRDSHLHLN